jgi:tetratricopeptide (TPR) repeat protein
VAEVVALLQSGSASFDRKQAELARMKQSGMLKEVTAQLEQQAAANPDQAQTLAALGQAYMKQVAGMEDLREQALLALKADQILESSLNLDPSNWEARFIKTVGMSYWPPQMNKNQDVLDQFQLLIRQQETESVRPEFVRSYLRLGDQYATGGQAEYARAVWQRGMEYFPDSAELKNRLRSQQ